MAAVKPPDDTVDEVLREPCPCDHCPLAQVCARTGFACRAFALYVQGRMWAGQPRQPTLAIGQRLGLVTAEDLVRWGQRLQG